MEDLDYDPFEQDDDEESAADLLTFLRQWTYSPGLSYISIRRMSPVQFRNFSTGGYLEDIHDPFDESWLAQRWGGGTFVVDVFQYSQGSGRSQRVEGRSITISGPPLYYRGPDGNPASIPGMAQQGNGSGAWNQEGYGGAQPASPFGAPTGGWGQGRPTFGQQQSAQRPPSYMPNAADVLNRNQQDVAVMNMVKDTVESSAAGQVAAVQAQTETLRSELVRERQEARRTRDQEGSAIASMWQPVQSTIASVQDQLRTQGDGHRSQMDALRQQNSEEMRSREEGHRREMEAMRLQNDGQLRGKDEEHRRYMDDLRERHRHEVDGLRDEMRRGEERGTERVRQTEQMILARFEAQLAAAKEGADRAEREADRRVGERDVEIGRIRDEMTTLREEKAKGLSSNLAEFAGVMTSFNTVAESMGMQKNAPEGAAPTDTLGKLLHYAPSIGQHVVEPVVKRVDNLAQAIRERNAMDQNAQVQQQQQQQQHAVSALPMATNAQGGMLPSHQPMPQMVYPPLDAPAPEMGVPAYTQPVPPQVPPPPQTPPPPQVPPQPTSEEAKAAEGVQTLFDLLHERLDQGGDAASTALEVQRLVPADQVAVLKLMDTAQLLAEVGELVGPDSPLTTPRGQGWLADVHTALKGS